jgi:hypothetical protein
MPCREETGNENRSPHRKVGALMFEESQKSSISKGKHPKTGKKVPQSEEKVPANGICLHCYYSE